jgi:nucleoside-diphosphate-sugar epimerase
VPCRKLEHIRELSGGPKLFIHCAFLTKDKLLDQNLETFIEANQGISDLVAGAIEHADARGLFMPSSGAVYNKGTHVLDDDLQANAYGVMKIADEKRFAELATLKKMPFGIPRLFNLSGPFINKHELYALSSMIKMVLAGRPITIRAAHRVLRSYIHVADLVTLAFAMLLEPQGGDEPVFDTAGDDVLDMDDLAKYVRVALGHPNLAIERPARVEGRDDVYLGDGQAMRRMMQGRNLALRDMPNQIRDTADFMQSSAAVTAPD